MNQWRSFLSHTQFRIILTFFTVLVLLLGYQNCGQKTTLQSEISMPSSGLSLPVINSFTANPPAITPGQSSSLSWNVTGATSVSISSVTTAFNFNVGSTTVFPNQTTDYTLTASGPGGVSTTTVTVSVNSNPNSPNINSFSAFPTTVSSASPRTTLSWNVSNATSITLSDGTLVTSGLAQVASAVETPSTTTTYVLTARGPGGSVSQQVVVTYVVATPTPTPTPTPSPTPKPSPTPTPTPTATPSTPTPTPTPTPSPTPPTPTPTPSPTPTGSGKWGCSMGVSGNMIVWAQQRATIASALPVITGKTGLSLTVQIPTETFNSRTYYRFGSVTVDPNYADGLLSPAVVALQGASCDNSVPSVLFIPASEWISAGTIPLPSDVSNPNNYSALSNDRYGSFKAAVCLCQ